MAGVRTAVVVVVTGTKAAADWMEKIAAASGRESLRVIFFEAWISLDETCECAIGGHRCDCKSRMDAGSFVAYLWTEEGTLNVVSGAGSAWKNSFNR